MLVEEIIGAFTGQNRRDRRRQVMIGTSLGLLTGLALGVLFAPKAGKETRQDIADAANKGLDRAKDLAEQGYGYAKQGLEIANEKAQGYAALVQDKLGRFTEFLPEDLEVCIVEDGEESALTEKMHAELSHEERAKLEREEARKERIALRDEQ